MDENQEDLLPVNDVNQLAEAILCWHGHGMAQLEQVLNAPDDVEISVSAQEGEDEIVLTAEQRVGLSTGIIIAKQIFGKLPFEASYVPEADAAEESPSEGVHAS